MVTWQKFAMKNPLVGPCCDWRTQSQNWSSNAWRKAFHKIDERHSFIWNFKVQSINFEMPIFLHFCFYFCVEFVSHHRRSTDSLSWIFLCPSSNMMRYFWTDPSHWSSCKWWWVETVSKRGLNLVPHTKRIVHFVTHSKVT